MSASADEQHSPPHSEQRPTKRRRGIACSECRDRKIRCDGTRPICDSCGRRNLPPERCIYAEAERPAAASTRYTKELEKRVHELEASIQEKTSPLPKIDVGFRPPRASTPSSLRRSVDEVVPTPSGIDCDDDAPANPAQDAFPLGESSISGFMKKAQETLERRGSSKAVSSSHVDSQRRSDSSAAKKASFGLMRWQRRPYNQQRLAAAVNAVMLPARELCEQLLQSFWDYEYPLMPLFHRPSFLSRYNQLWETSNAESSTNSFETVFEKASFYCLLCGVLAMSYRNSTSTGYEDPESEAFGSTLIERAKSLLYSGLLESASVEIVQALIFVAMYQRRMGNHHEAWISIGLASRVAQALGIHYAIDDGSQVEREIKRRTWYGCVILDSMHTTVFGQAPIAATISLPLPSMIDDIYMETDPNKPDREQPDDAIPEIAFFIFCTKLSGVTVNILRAIYNTGHPSLKDIPLQDFRSSILRYDSDLQRWKNELPPYLRIERKDDYLDEIRLRLIMYMRVRYLDCRFLLFRATILRLASRAPDLEISNLQEHVTRACLESCISAIRELMELFQKHRFTAYIPGPKHNVVSLLTASTVLALIVRSQVLIKYTPGDPQACTTLLGDCMNLLRSYDRTHFPLRRKGAADAVERLMRVSTDAETQDRVAQFAQQQRIAVAAAAAAAGSSSGIGGNNNSNSNTTSSSSTNLNPSTLINGTTPRPPPSQPTDISDFHADPLFGPAEFNVPPPSADFDLFNSNDILGNLTGDLQNPASWSANDLDPFGLGFTSDFSIQDILDPTAAGALDGGSAGAAGAGGAATGWYGPQPTQPPPPQYQQQYEQWWQPQG